MIEAIAFFQGKVKMVKFVSMKEDLVSSMNLLGEEDETFAAVKEALEILVCLLYQVKFEIDVKEHRYKVFTKKKRSPVSVFAPYKRYYLSAY